MSDIAIANSNSVAQPVEEDYSPSAPLCEGQDDCPHCRSGLQSMERISPSQSQPTQRIDGEPSNVDLLEQKIGRILGPIGFVILISVPILTIIFFTPILGLVQAIMLAVLLYLIAMMILGFCFALITGIAHCLLGSA